MPFIQISGATPAIFRSTPRQEKLLLLSPKQETIFTYLSKIPHQRFPEFIGDILASTDGHKIVDLSDAPGDEKQDILTINPEGKRCLFQCKHTTNRRIKYSGNLLDRLFAASIRKNCDVAIFVTNGDLSTQGKRYINDSEYKRKTIPQNGAIVIDYWNGDRIWQKLQTNPTILNKWFGNLGQAHGLRNFSFEITLYRLPYHLTASSDIYEQLLDKLLELGKIEQTERRFVYKGSLGNKVSFIINRSHQFQSNFDINYLSPEDDKRYVNKPLESLAIAVTIKDNAAFTPRSVRKQILSYLVNEHLPPIPSDSWWHIVCSRITSFIFIHDISKSKPVSLDSCETFIKSESSKVMEEILFCKLKREFKQAKHTADRTIHSISKCQVMQYFTQKREPFDEFNNSGVQFTQYSFMSDCIVQSTGKTDAITQREIVKMLPGYWFSFTEDKMLIWFIPEDEKLPVIQSVEKNINSLGFQVFPLTQKAKAAVIDNIKMHLPDFIIHDNLNMVRFPIDLSRRKFVISNSFSFDQKAGFDLIESLVKFKLSYERHWGYINELYKKSYSYRDLTDILFQPGEMRGEKMFDINIWDNPIEIVMQFNKCPVKPSNEVATSFVEEFKYTESFIKNLFESMIIKKDI